MDAFNFVRDILELWSFIASILIAVFAWKALGQITASKEIARTQAKREALRIAAEKTVQFAEEIIPLTSEYNKLKKEGKYPFLTSTQVTESWPHVECKTDNFPGMMQEVFSNNGLVVKILNRMEGFAMFFTCGVADADVAYRPVSSVFCQCAKNFLPYIIICNERERQYTYTLKLYSVWSMRTEKEKSEKIVQEHSKNISKITVPNIEPLLDCDSEP